MLSQPLSCDDSCNRLATHADLKKATAFLARRLARLSDPLRASASSLFYLSSWSAEVAGHQKLLELLDLPHSKLRTFSYIVHSVIGLLSPLHLVLKLPPLHRQRIETVVFSWCTLADAQAIAEEQRDRYFGSFRGEPHDQVLRIYSPLGDFNGVFESYLQQSRVGYFRMQRSLPLFLRGLRILFGVILKAGFKARDLSSIISREFVFHEVIAYQIAGLMRDLPNVKTAVFPYEAQPLQHRLITEVRKFGIKTIGYVHASLTSLPTDLIRRPGAPDRLWVHGTAHRRILEEACGWQPTAVFVVDSMRYGTRRGADQGRYIYLPYYIKNRFRIIQGFREVLQRGEYASVEHLETKIHPNRLTDPAHLRLKRDLDQLLDQYRHSLGIAPSSPKRAYVAGATVAAMELLEEGFEVIHVVENPLLDAFSDKIWKEIAVREVALGVYLYRLIDQQSLIRIGDGGPSSLLQTLAQGGSS